MGRCVGLGRTINRSLYFLRHNRQCQTTRCQKVPIYLWLLVNTVPHTCIHTPYTNAYTLATVTSINHASSEHASGWVATATSSVSSDLQQITINNAKIHAADLKTVRGVHFRRFVFCPITNESTSTAPSVLKPRYRLRSGRPPRVAKGLTGRVVHAVNQAQGRLHSGDLIAPRKYMLHACVVAKTAKPSQKQVCFFDFNLVYYCIGILYYHSRWPIDRLFGHRGFSQVSPARLPASPAVSGGKAACSRVVGHASK